MIDRNELAEILTLEFKYDILLNEDLSDMVSTYGNIYRALAKVKKDCYQPQERIVFYTQHPIPNRVLQHVQQALTRLDVPNFFVLLVTAHECTEELFNVMRDYSTEDSPIKQLQMAVRSNPLVISDLIPLPSNFCLHPWINLEIGPENNFAPCCQYNAKFQTSGSIERDFNSSSMIELRQAFLKNKKHDHCSVCWSVEDHGGISFRQRRNDSKDPNIHSALYEKEIAPISNLMILDTKHGNACNLKCRICGPNASSRIMIEDMELSNQKVDHKAIQLKASRPEMFNSIIEIAKDSKFNLRYLEFYGGEPFMFKGHRSFLDQLIVTGKSSEINLHYNTNGTFDIVGFNDAWSNFKSVNLSFSIDDVGDRFEYQRHGARWDNVNQNVINALEARTDNSEINIYITVSIFNILYVGEVVNWARCLGIPDHSIHFNILTNPAHLNFKDFPVAVRSEIQRQLIALNDSKFGSLISMLGEPDHNSNIIELFFFETNRRDQIRQENFRKVFPELYNLLTQET